jgi:enoyl-CoA hydratase
MKHLKTRQEGNVGIIELINPPYNFMTKLMVKELDELTKYWEKDSNIRAIIITGGIKGYFITHYSVNELVDTFAPFSKIPRKLKPLFASSIRIFTLFNHFFESIPVLRVLFEKILTITPVKDMPNLERIHRVFNRLQLMPKPVIAAINGDAMGGGCELALSCDYRLMARGENKIGLIEVLIGITPGAAGAIRLARIIGPEKAVQMILDGVVLDADEAQKIGIIYKAVDKDKLLEDSFKLASRLVTRSPAAVQGVKRLMRLGYTSKLYKYLIMEKYHFSLCGMTKDAQQKGKQYLKYLEKGKLPRDIFDLLRAAK